MASEPLVLGFDTSAAYCAAVLLCGDRIIAAQTEEMRKGQVERLMPMMQEMLDKAGVSWRDLARIGVGIGPGNFTGIRIAVSAARGLALALEIPAVGVSTFEAISLGRNEVHLPIVEGPRDQIYVQALGEEPQLVPRDEADELGLPLVGASSAPKLVEAIAHIAAAQSGERLRAPAPLYVKPADASPSRMAAPIMLDDDA